MQDADAVTNAERWQLLTKAKALVAVKNSSFEDEAETRQKLNAHGIPDELIAKQLATLQSNTAKRTAVLTSYSLLHSLQHLDAIQETSPRRRDSADAVIALFRCAEVCLYNIAVLSGKMVTCLAEGNVSRAIAHARWRNGFQEVLYRLSALTAEVGGDALGGPLLSIQSSPNYELYQRGSRALQGYLMTGWREDTADIFGRGLDDAKRYVFFNEFVNASDERIWLSRLSAARLAGVERAPNESDGELYERVVRSSEITLMAQALETKADTDLLSFRAVHQIAEIIAGYVNLRLCNVVEDLLSAHSLDSVPRRMLVCNRLLTVVDDAMKLLMRALTPSAYKDIRPNLGMVKGTSSVMLRKTLFNGTYPLLLRAFKLRLTEFSAAAADDDEAVCALTTELFARREHHLTALVEQLIVLYQHVRTWRDNHQQFPKTHLGVSPLGDRPTVSLSGSASAVDIAHQLRKVHASDPIAPLYRAALGTDPPAVHQMLTPGEFDEYMAHQTAQAVFAVYADVQTRFYERVQRDVQARRVPHRTADA